jgi:L-threonylcarbamoyladenylate synthase
VAEIIRVDPVHPDAALIERAARCLRRGGLVAFPTETVYGVGADATNRDAVRRIFAVKQRPATDPLIVHVADLAAVRLLVAHVPEVALDLASAFWPGPLTLVLPRSPLVPDEVTAGLDSVAVRVPAHPVARALVRAAGVPVAAPSANLFSRPSPTKAEHVVDDLGPALDLILDGGPTAVGLESTVLDLTGLRPTVLRPGGVSLEQLQRVVPSVVLRVAQRAGDTAMAAPGMLTRHYAPRTPLTLFEGGARAMLDRVILEASRATGTGQRIALLGTSEALLEVKPALAVAAQGTIAYVELGSHTDPDGIAAHLFAGLRECDSLQASRILAVQVPDATGISLAIRDRLRRASAGHIVIC